MSRTVRFDGEPVDLSARAVAGSDGGFTVSIGESVVRVRVAVAPDGSLVVEREDGRRFVAAVTRDGSTHWVTIAGRTSLVEEVDVHAGESAAGGLEAPMPGKVLSVAVEVGETVTAGQTLLIVEAMKMEHAIKAPHDGVVEAIAASEGEMVGPGAPLVTLSGEGGA